LTNEGEAQFREARNRQAAGQFDSSVPEIDFPSSSWLVTTSYYPLYGKLNLFDWRVVQFDVYGVAGLGQMNLRSGVSGTWTAGGGIGFWWNNWFSSRFELRHQQYTDRVQTGNRDVGMLVGTFGFGVLL
jgi:outer membrane beta-barrel protein